MNADEVLRRGPHWVIALAVGLVVCGASRAQAIAGYPQSVESLDLREVAMLPHYCIYTQMFRDKVPGGNDKAVIDGWYAKLGTPFHALHHYCLGLMKTNRALHHSRDRSTRDFYLTDAIMEYDYVIDRSTDEFILLPEMLTKKGENLVLLGRGPRGIYEFERAIQLKNDYWPPYAQISDFYKSTGDIKKARESLEAGLAQSPNATALQRRLVELESPVNRRSGKR